MARPPESSSDELCFARRQQIEARYSHYSRNAFVRHSHAGYALAAITRGATELTLYSASREERLPAGAGDVVLLNPGQAHACNPLPGSDFAYYMLYLEPGYVEQLCQVRGATSPAGLTFRQPILRGLPWLHAGLLSHARLLCRHDSRFDPSALEDVLADVFFLYGAFTGETEDARVDAGRLEESRQALLANLAVETPVETLARIGGLSPCQYVRAFHRQYGLPPIAYKLQQRVHLAMRLLREGRSIAEVSAEAGFADQSHFTRKFKVLVGATPGQYQREIIRQK